MEKAIPEGMGGLDLVSHPEIGRDRLRYACQPRPYLWAGIGGRFQPDCSVIPMLLDARGAG